MDKITAFFKGYYQRKIDDNVEALENYANNIKNKCRSLEIAPLRYCMLSPIYNERTLSKWNEFGEYMIEKSKGMKKSVELIEISEDYLKMANVIDNRRLNKTAQDLAKVVIGLGNN